MLWREEESNSVDVRENTRVNEREMERKVKGDEFKFLKAMESAQER